MIRLHTFLALFWPNMQTIITILTKLRLRILIIEAILLTPTFLHAYRT